MRFMSGTKISHTKNNHVDIPRMLAFVLLAHEADLWVVRNFCDGDFRAGFDAALPMYDLADDLDPDLGPANNSPELKAALNVIHEVLRQRSYEGDARGGATHAGAASTTNKTPNSLPNATPLFLPPRGALSTKDYSTNHTTPLSCVQPRERFRFRVLTDFDDTAMPPKSGRTHKISGMEGWAHKQTTQGANKRARYYNFHKVLNLLEGEPKTGVACEEIEKTEPWDGNQWRKKLVPQVWKQAGLLLWDRRSEKGDPSSEKGEAVSYQVYVFVTTNSISHVVFVSYCAVHKQTKTKGKSPRELKQ